MNKSILVIALILGCYLILPAQVVEIIGKGSEGQTSVQLPITNSATIDEISVEAVYWAGAVERSGIDAVNMADPDENYDENTTETEHREYNIFYPAGYSGFFKHDFTDIDAGDIDLTIPDDIDEETYSAVAFIYRTFIAPTYYSMVDRDHAEFYQNGSVVGADNPGPYELIFSLDETDYEKDLRVWVPLTQLNDDDRYAYVTVTAGTSTTTVSIQDYNQGASLWLDPIVLEDVAGDVDEVVISIYSPNSDPAIDDEEGDSFITSGAVVDVMCDKHCTLTQVFYGSYCAKFCGCNRAYDILFDLLEQDLVVGDIAAGNSLTLTQEDVSCLQSRLPGWGVPAALNGDATCDNPVGIATSYYGRFKNSLLNQTITMGLNLRLDPTLADVELEDKYMVTVKVADCRDADCEPATGCRVKKTYCLPQLVLDELGDDNTIGDLFALANAALAGEDMGDLPLYKIKKALGTINCGFNRCRILDKFSSHKAAEINDEIIADMMEFNLYPNPATTSATIDFTAISEERTTVEVYSMMGVRTDVLFDDFVEEDVAYSFELDVSSYSQGMYIVFVKNGDNITRSKVSVVR